MKKTYIISSDEYFGVWDNMRKFVGTFDELL